MVLKKPYAFLIKNFRIIHIILTAVMVFIAYRCHSIVTFFRNFIANNYSVTLTDNLVETTIGSLIYLAIGIAIVALVAIYILLRTKKKPNKFYLINIIYLVVLIIFLIIGTILIGALDEGLWSAADARTYRDFAQLIYYPIYVFVLILGMRSLGFNVKQFDFKNDIKELEITEKDNEEVELNINFKTYKLERFIRRLIREFKYYFLENKMIFIIIGSILAVVVAFFLYQNYEKIRYSYKEGETFSYHGLQLNFIESMITNVDLNGNFISEGKAYVVLKFSVTNNSNGHTTLNYNNFKLYYGSDYVYPNLEVGKYFLDYGDPYMNNYIAAGETSTYIMSYIIDEKYQNKSFKLSIYLGSATKSDDFLAKTATVKIKPSKVSDLALIRSAGLNEIVSFSSSTIQDSSLSISSVYISNRYEYNYEVCYQSNCRTYTDVVVADNTYQTKQALIVLDYDLVLDSTASSYKNINDIKAFASNFMAIEYTYGGETKTIDVTYANPSNFSEKLILQTDGIVASAESVKLIITIRNQQYIITLVDE